ncbi:hypothetical protein [Bradyrhizobium sp. JYMT SZCCT0428]|uniref:hypothetical protein n=1 Tax=Bradyrhizobium sp. JYMT SZCCT0428 TaxID=2807673 RepID=UPI001BAA85CB|nr:hypothetical protein [Bradyrhizobium sp. JYMT SZCCT0428]MBR1152397.1 hypothetical protein [Bradyrhizobium sp. JYMT SZCCT0428]
MRAPNIVRFAFLIALPRSATLHAVILRRDQRLTAGIRAICAVSGILTGSYPPKPFEGEALRQQAIKRAPLPRRRSMTRALRIFSR